MATTTYGTPYVASTDLVANWPAASLTVANSLDQAGYFIGRGLNAQTASYTLVLTDAGKTITMTVGTANVLNIPANASVAFPIGTRINIINLGAGTCTTTALAGVTISGTVTALAANAAAAIIKTGTNAWSYVPFSSGAGNAVFSDTPTGTYTGYSYKIFTASGTLTVTTAGFADIVVASGGGGGGGQYGGGGGAGGSLQITNAYFPTGTLTVTVGAGGSGAAAAAEATAGEASRIGSYFCPGGGNGGGTQSITGERGDRGASGGGGQWASGVGGGAVSSLGFAGGNGSASFGGGGGGGAGAVGANGVTTTGGNGGAGTSTSIAGTFSVPTPGAYSAGSYNYGGGGGAGASVTAGTGGTGGGANGTTGATGAAGGINTGGGGGSAGGTSVGGNGGSGIVIVRVAV